MNKEDRNKFILYLKWIYSYLIKRFLIALQKDSLKKVIEKIFLTLLSKNKIDLDNFELDKNLSLNEIFIKFATDKGTVRQIPKDKKKYSNYFNWIKRDTDLKDCINEEGHNYTPFYEKHLPNLKNKKFKMLELGVASGHSTASFYYWFPNAEFYCTDIKSKYKFFYKGKRINNYTSLDLRNEKEVKKYLKRFNNFNVIIEDAIHNKLGIFTSFKNFFPHLSQGGYYVIEDFKADDIMKKYNFDPNEPCSSEQILKNFQSKSYFNSQIINKSYQMDFFEKIEDVQIYQGKKFDSSICFIKKK